MRLSKLRAWSAFDVVNAIFLAALAATCVLPFVNVIAVSLSDSAAATANLVGFWPVSFSLDSYAFAFQKARFLASIWNSAARVVLGVAVNIALTIVTAYPLSKTGKEFRGRTAFAWFFVITMLIGGGMIPTYLIVMWSGLRNTIWSMIIPGAVPVFNVVILLNFFRQLPKELEESAILDGAGDWRVLLQIYLPLSMACIATLIVFQTVAHWNEWFSGMIYLDSIEKYPLATYLHNVLQRPSFDNMELQEIQRVMKISNRTLSSAQILIGALPVILVYPFLQRFFVKGMTLGSLKG
ncbi:MAG: carbohydrate ABC transporter permease [Clostridiales bacterium]|jgi:putative aldouronate transport system permease protein|nr:carbohydrate ABC transporter permease [Clostridiales bacterium]